MPFMIRQAMCRTLSPLTVTVSNLLVKNPPPPYVELASWVAPVKSQFVHLLGPVNRFTLATKYGYLKTSFVFVGTVYDVGDCGALAQ